MSSLIVNGLSDPVRALTGPGAFETDNPGRYGHGGIRHGHVRCVDQVFGWRSS